MRFKALTGCFLASLLATAAFADDPAAPAFQNDDEKTAYAVGLSVWRNLSSLDLTPAELDLALRAIRDAAAGVESPVDLDEYEPKIRELREARMLGRAEAEKTKGAAWAAEFAKGEGVESSDSGLLFQELTAGTGEQPTASDIVEVHYRGTFIDGSEFDSSYSRDKPTEFPLRRVIPCWTEAVQKMKAGGKAKIVCPSDIAYGDRGRGPIPGGSTLVFEVELLKVMHPEKVVDPVAPPATAPSE